MHKEAGGDENTIHPIKDCKGSREVSVCVCVCVCVYIYIYIYIYSDTYTKHRCRLSGQLHAPATLPPEKNPGTHFLLGGLQSQRERFSKEKNALPLPGFELQIAQSVV